MLALAGLALTAAPAHAQAAETVGYILPGVATVAVVAAIALYINVTGERRRRRAAESETRLYDDERRRLEEVLAAAPDGYFVWRLDADGAILNMGCSRRLAVLLGLFSGTESGFADILATFASDQAGVLEVAVEGLHRHGTGFELELALREGGRRLMVIGARAGDTEGRAFADVLWMRDITDDASAMDRLSRETGALATERDRLRALTDAISVPVWLRSATLDIAACNQAYAKAVGAESPAAVVAAGTELVPAGQVREARALAARARAAGQARSESFHLVMAGARRRVEILEAPAPAGEDGALVTIGVAIDRTEQEELQAQMERHIAAHAGVLENLGTAIAIFATDTRLTFFNTAYQHLWRLDPDWLASRPSYAQVLDQLREQRRLPEVTDFRAYKAEEHKRFTALLEPYEDLLHLPDERTLRRSIAPHPFGGLLITYEDVTDALALERSLTTSLAVHRATLQNLHEGVAVFSGDGRLRLSNPAFGTMWRLTPEKLDAEPHFTELVEAMRGYFHAGEWAEEKPGLLGLMGERSGRNGRIERADGSIVDYASMPLPDGAVLTTWLDVSDTARLATTRRERDQALALAQSIRSEFAVDVNSEVRTPLNAMLGLADLLSGGESGALSDRQAEYARAIAEAGRRLLFAVDDIHDNAAFATGSAQLAPGRVDINAMLSAIIQRAKLRTRDKRVTLALDCPAEIGAMVADEQRLRRALHNLLGSALAATPAGGRVALAARRDGAVVEFVIAAAAAAMIDADRSAIFAGLRQADEEAEMGLSLARRIIELHRGTLVIEDLPTGTTRALVRVPAGGS
jgi:signal transduction histidine kinase